MLLNDALSLSPSIVRSSFNFCRTQTFLLAGACIVLLFARGHPLVSLDRVRWSYGGEIQSTCHRWCPQCHRLSGSSRRWTRGRWSIRIQKCHERRRDCHPRTHGLRLPLVLPRSGTPFPCSWGWCGIAQTGSCWGKRPKGRATRDLAIIVRPQHNTFQPHTALPDSAACQSSLRAEIGSEVLDKVGCQFLDEPSA